MEDEKISDNTQRSYEEISEKRTSKLGYILLILMVLFVIGVGETIFSDLKDILKEPVHPSYCIFNTTENFENLTYISCPDYSGFNETDKKFNLDAKYNEIAPQLQEIVLLDEDITLMKEQIVGIESDVQRLNTDYGLSLQEKAVGEKPIIDKDGVKTEIIESKFEIDNLKNEIISLVEQKNLISSQIAVSIKSLRYDYDGAMEDYKNKVAWYNFKSFLLNLIFVLPFFALSVYFYLRLKRKNSPYTIILTATTTAFSVLLLQVVAVFLYDILPKEWFALIFGLLFGIPFLRYIIYYGSVILVVGLFGGIVYYIQKKVFSPAKVAIRRLKDKKCPKCSFSVDSQHNFCPDCGIQLKEKCENCGNFRIKYLSHCPNCGSK